MNSYMFGSIMLSLQHTNDNIKGTKIELFCCFYATASLNLPKTWVHNIILFDDTVMDLIIYAKTLTDADTDDKGLFFQGIFRCIFFW